ncbi:DNA-binding NarL/FixJ family response regulator [Catenulispora sp. GAS73]|uniref:response regulator transcription factor n=1 Tax=Catenulispora sp. GAS73 TaxID=3156269 RepID=UPI0035152EBD
MIADDHPIVRDGLSALLGLLPDVVVVGTAVDGEDAVEVVLRTKPDVVLMDLRMPRLGGVAAISQILARNPEIGIIGLTAYCDDGEKQAAFLAGAADVLTKDAERHQIYQALIRAVAGTRREERSQGHGTRIRTVDLTCREIDVLRLIAEGRSNREIGDVLQVSTATVKTHINRIFAKIEVRDRAQAVRFAYISGLAASDGWKAVGRRSVDAAQAGCENAGRVEVGPLEKGSERFSGEKVLSNLRSFPGRIAVACTPPHGARAMFGGENENGRGFAVHVIYEVPARRWLVVRTKAASLSASPDNPALFVTIDTLQNAFGLYNQARGRPTLGGPPPKGMSSVEVRAWMSERAAARARSTLDFRSLPRSPFTLLVDGVGVDAVRVDYPDCSGLELNWDGQTVQCVGDPSDIDMLSLRTAVEADYA